MEQSANSPAPQKRLSAVTLVKDYFLTGVLVLIPSVVTLWVLKAILDFVDGFFEALPEAWQPQTYAPVPGVGIVVTALLVLLVGAFARNYLGRVTYHYGDRLMSNIPVLRSVYKAVKQMLQTVVSSPTDNFRKVVLIEYPRKGVYTIAFSTGAARGEIQDFTSKKVYNVFVPTAPNPTSGYMLIIAEDEIVPLKMSVEDAFKIIISGGMVNPGEGDETLERHLPRPIPKRVRPLEKKVG
jgi:uncharacterized membrane protein